MEIKIPGVDTEKGLEFCNGETDIYINILKSYVLDMSSFIEKITNVTEETLQDYTICVHSIKSISEAIGAELARKTAKLLEDTGKNGDLAGVLARNDPFIKYIKKLTEDIDTWVKNYESE